MQRYKFRPKKQGLSSRVSRRVPGPRIRVGAPLLIKFLFPMYLGIMIPNPIKKLKIPLFRITFWNDYFHGPWPGDLLLKGKPKIPGFSSAAFLDIP